MQDLTDSQDTDTAHSNTAELGLPYSSVANTATLLQQEDSKLFCSHHSTGQPTGSCCMSQQHAHAPMHATPSNCRAVRAGKIKCVHGDRTHGYTGQVRAGCEHTFPSNCDHAWHGSSSTSGSSARGGTPVDEPQTHPAERQRQAAYRRPGGGPPADSAGSLCVRWHSQSLAGHAAYRLPLATRSTSSFFLMA